MLKRTLALMTALVMGASLLAGCGAASESTSPATEEAAAEEASGEGAEAAEGDEAAEDAESGEAESAGDAQADGDVTIDGPVVEDDFPPDSIEAGEEFISGKSGGTQADISEAPEIPGLTCESVMPLGYAECFNVFYYNDGFKLIDVPISGQYLIVPEGAEEPEDLPEDMYVIYQPLDSIYMAATGVMSFYDALGVMDKVTMTSLNESGWTIEAPIEALKSGAMTFAGKYSAPDYETLINKECDLCLESTMILHTPEVQEMLEDLGMPVFIDRSSYELSALGRIEWIKLYGAMMNVEDTANEKFAEQEAIVNSLADFENTGKTVAFFSINSNREVVVRKTEDFIPEMIKQAGGKYIFEDLKNPGSNSASVTMNMETFYDAAVNADYLIYNGTIQEPLKSIDDLIAKDALFAEFKAVQEGNVWQVDSRWYQATAQVGSLVTDLNAMLTGKDDTGLVFMTKLS